MTALATAPVSRLRRRQRTRAGAVVLVGMLACLVLVLVSLGMGVAGVPPDRALPAIFGVGDRFDLLVVQKLQLPRSLAAILAGIAFGLAGALFQYTLRNSLASPDLLGISGGASLGAITAILGYGATGLAITGSALLGGLATATAIWLLAWRGGLHGLRFVLVGVGISYVCASLISWRLAEADLREGGTVLLWTVGSVADIRDGMLALLAIGVGLLAVLALLVGRWLRPLALGDDHAHGLGVAPDRARLLALLVGVGLVALATAVAGPIAFVALVAPAIARRLVDDGGPALPAAAAVGALLTLGSDVLGQAAPFGFSAPVGVVTGLVGAPYLLWLLARSERKATS
ncbi:FecCD family ABC transporter permease [Nocardioides nitrophenolicus]|uniref:FecCD family ABC transporter permease n=1 Tax=Nocardioides nitrophenolicus TaxID=60489 RepID=UPI001956D9EA|nr:iron chelate uptake ABC transporter family permease subunit [Nocardioides nitrophenolicus]MBM7519942.1 iron complex transport system permease protein [Nocardioides nitrophenolicus]